MRDCGYDKFWVINWSENKRELWYRGLVEDWGDDYGIGVDSFNVGEEGAQKNFVAC